MASELNRSEMEKRVSESSSSDSSSSSESSSSSSDSNSTPSIPKVVKPIQFFGFAMGSKASKADKSHGERPRSRSREKDEKSAKPSSSSGKSSPSPSPSPARDTRDRKSRDIPTRDLEPPKPEPIEKLATSQTQGEKLEKFCPKMSHKGDTTILKPSPTTTLQRDAQQQASSPKGKMLEAGNKENTAVAQEETLFSQVTGKKKTRRLPNLGDFQKQKRVTIDELSGDDEKDSADLSKEDMTELELAEKLLEESIASGKTKKILPEKEGETVRQELVIDGDRPGEKKTIIQEITKRRISNPGKLPTEFIHKMEGKEGGIFTVYETRTKMTTTRLQGHDTSEFADMDAEDLLEQLNQDELDELANDVDPDDPLLPPSERCITLTKKLPTGPLNRRNLLKFLEQQSMNEDDWEEPVPFKKEVRGKIWKAKPRTSTEEYRISIDLPEYEDALDQASEADLVDIAGILDLHSLVNQTQYNNSFKSLSSEKGGFRAIARGDKLKILPPEPPNTTNPYESLKQLENNDPSLHKLTLNNIKDIPPSTYVNICRSIKDNTELENLSLVNTRLTDSLAKILADSIRHNKSLRSVNLESNALSPEAVVLLFAAVCDNRNIVEFKAANQRNTYLGNTAEMDIANLMAHNHKILRLGLCFNVADARVRVAAYLKRNQDELRLKRLQGED